VEKRYQIFTDSDGEGPLRTSRRRLRGRHLRTHFEQKKLMRIQHNNGGGYIDFWRGERGRKWTTATKLRARTPRISGSKGKEPKGEEDTPGKTR